MGTVNGIRKCETCIILGILVISIGISPTPAVKAAALADTYPIAEWGTGEAASISYSADGSLMAVGTVAGYILVYDTANYNLIQTIKTGMLLGYFEDLSSTGTYDVEGSIAISPDNQFVGAVAVDESVGMWEIKTGKQKFIDWGTEHGNYSFDSQIGRNVNCYFLGRGEIFVINSYEYSRFSRFFRTEDGVELVIGQQPMQQTNSSDLRFYLGGRTIDWIKWIEWKNDRSYFQGTWQPESNTDDGTYFFGTSGYQGAVWDSHTGQALVNIDFPQTWQGLTPSPDARWNILSQFSKDKKFIVVSYSYDKGQDYLTTVWNLADKKEVGEFLSPAHISHTLEIRPTDDQLAYPVAGGVEIASLPSGEVIKTILFNSCAGKLKLSPDGKLIASYFSTAIYICQASNGNLIRTIKVPTGNITDIDWSPDSSQLISSGETSNLVLASQKTVDTKIYLWDVNTGAEINAFEGQTGDGEMVAFSPDGKLIVSIGSPGERNCQNFGSGNEIIIRQVSDGKVINKFKPTRISALNISFTKDSSKLIIIESDGCSSTVVPAVYLVDLRGNAIKIDDAGKIYDVEDFFQEPDGKILTFDGKIWDVSGLKPILVTTIPFSNLMDQEWPHGTQISPDGTMAVSNNYTAEDNGKTVTEDIFLTSLDGNRQIALLQEKGIINAPFSSTFLDENKTVIISPYELAGIIYVFSIPSSFVSNSISQPGSSNPTNNQNSQTIQINERSIFDNTYYAIIDHVDLSDNLVKVFFESHGNSDLRTPESSCIVEKPSGLEIKPSEYDTPIRQSTYYKGSLTFIVNINPNSSYYFRYSCETFYSDVLLFETDSNTPPSIKK